MKLPYKLTSLDQVDEAYRSLYEAQADGSFVFNGVEGIKTQDDINRLTTSLNAEREAHAKTKGFLTGYNSHGTVEEVAAALARIPALEEAAKGKVDESKIEELVRQRVQNETIPLKSQIELLNGQLSEKETALKEMSAKDKRRMIGDAIRKACVTAQIAADRIDDVVALTAPICTITEDGNVVTNEHSGVPGLSVEVWLGTQRKSRYYWWGESAGAGAQGSRGGKDFGDDNPWTFENWNITKQGQIMIEDRAKAEQMAKAAGTTVDGPKPAKK